MEINKKGRLYIGRESEGGEPVLLKASTLTTHGVIFGMTGSGKTGLGVNMLEEALLGGTPTLILDPKGDMGNLELLFPDFAGSDFEPWVSADEARKDGVTPAELGQKTADLWKKGIAGWDPGLEAIRRLKDTIDVTIYTPGSQAGVPVNVVGSLAAPDLDWSLDAEAGRDEIEGFVSSLLTLAGIDAAQRVGLTPVKINCVVQRGVNDHTFVDLARRFRGTGHIVRFIEIMDVGTRNAWDLAQVVTAAEIVERIHAEFPLAPADRNYRGEVAKRHVYQDGSGEIGVIASVTAPFCSDCSRARLSAAGSLITCLFASGGIDLKTPLRRGASDDEILGIIRDVWALRTDRYSEERAAITPAPCARDRSRIEMHEIGG